MATSNREYGAFYPSAMSSGLGMAAAAAASQDRVSRGVSRDLWKDKHGNRHGVTESELRKSKSSHLSRGLGSEGSRQTPVSYGKFTAASGSTPSGARARQAFLQPSGTAGRQGGFRRTNSGGGATPARSSSTAIAQHPQNGVSHASHTSHTSHHHHAREDLVATAPAAVMRTLSLQRPPSSSTKAEPHFSVKELSKPPSPKTLPPRSSGAPPYPARGAPSSRESGALGRPNPPRSPHNAAMSATASQASGSTLASRMTSAASRPNSSLRTSQHPPGTPSGFGDRGGAGVRLSGPSGKSLPALGELQYGGNTVGGVAPGFYKENQDDYLVVHKPYAHSSVRAPPAIRVPHASRSAGGGDPSGGAGQSKDFFAAVMDGHGLAGKRVSGFVKDRLLQEEVQRKLQGDDPDEALHWAFNKAASELKRSGIDCRESGSTTVSCLRKGDELLVANVGDSRCVMGRMEGGNMRAVPLSRDHKPQRKDELERIVRSHGFVEPSRAYGGRYVGPARVWAIKQQVGGLAVSRAIGDTNLNSVGVIPTPEIIKEKVTNNDKFVILASDGVWEHLSSQDAVDAAKQHWQDPKKASEVIVQKARDAWGKERCGYRDDITAVVVKLE
mmetsp:Transcript_47223/g.90139  ORF Transcript_47223/g.90139 Transcript_47223/m.90139 type:complete len:613 (-) Transcript_47223:216-2054(-)